MRPPKPNARTLTTTVKLTATEAATLTQRYGSPYRGIRAALDLMLNTEPATPQPTPQVVTPKPVNPAPQPAQLGQHWHRREGTPTMTMTNGQATKIWHCACGLELH